MSRGFRVPDSWLNRPAGGLEKCNWTKCCRLHRESAELRKKLDFEGILNDESIYEAVIDKKIKLLPGLGHFDGRFIEASYAEILNIMMKIDQAYSEIWMHKYDLFDYRLLVERIEVDEKVVSKKLYIEIEGVEDAKPLLMAGDLVLLYRSSSDFNETKIDSIAGDKIYLERINNVNLEERSLNIIFYSQNTTYAMYRRAFIEFSQSGSLLVDRIFERYSDSLKLADAQPKMSLSEFETHARLGGLYDDLLFEDDDDYAIEDQHDNEVELECQERFNKLNQPQQDAVRGILEAKCRPKPYILFGPPGTGKTLTLIEAIVQIYARSQSAKILFCANSNTCADQALEKLEAIDLIRSNSVRRLRARERVDRFDLIRYRVIITTNMKSSNLIGLMKFDYVFIDEAVHAHEAETLLPLSLVEGDGCWVLAGDPKQLGPCIQYEELKTCGLDKSMMERIIEFAMYQRDPISNSFDNKYITKLLYCYRCDPRILAISNMLFYKNELESVAKTPSSLLKMMHLTTPVQFNHVRGEQSKPANSTSWLNEDEADACVDLITRLYKMGLEPDQIGVITPYKLQSKHIYKKLAEKLRGGTRDILEGRFQVVVRRRELKKKKKSETETEDEKATVDKYSQDIELPEKMGHHESNVDDVTSIFKLLTMNKEEPPSDKRNTNGEKDKTDHEEEEYVWVEEIVARKDKWLCKIDTVDAFQGNEREVIIISTVRTPSGKGSGFINESRRFNVALTRASRLVFVLGHKEVLNKLDNWREYMHHGSNTEVAAWPEQRMAENPYKPLRPLFRKDP